MTYWFFLFLFLFIPIIIFLVIALLDPYRGLAVPARFLSMPYWTAIALHMLIAPTYTFLWDNYLVAERDGNDLSVVENSSCMKSKEAINEPANVHSSWLGGRRDPVSADGRQV